MEKTRIAVAGAGYIGLAHMAAARQSGTCTLSAIVDPSPAAQAVAAKEGVPLYPSLDALFEKERPDGVILATPNPLHLEHALTCLQARVPMLLEKPVTPTVAEAEKLVNEVDRAGVKVLIGHHRAHSPIMARAKQVIDEERLGALVAVMGSAVFFKPDQYFADAPWRRQPGGGPVLLNMIHEVHNLRMLCGDIVAVQAFASRATRGFPVEDTVAINLRFANGALGSFMLSDTAASARSWEQTSQENNAYPTYPDEDCYMIAGTFGSLSVPTMRMKSWRNAEDRSWWKPFETSVADVTRDDPLRLQIEHFARVIRGEAEPLVSVRDGLQNLKITEAIVQAARTGAIVDTTPAH
ncbi:MAG: Gfo/Idh/MocA family oxidoreductase [Paraburkholderia sp.]|uniref:Gfo/Idh/MocA family protein n=1 Tax=Paraburkholderia sp. TaxID=1926495 RepID=UPI001207E91D|nr:Gfo/Idh/MocA family oxidoreductase [Paraburkholderia sp.]TAL94309.1 MAG: Gfo/Idh/MocA family oxidoreductase [Paraburkholderia sp.]